MNQKSVVKHMLQDYEGAAETMEALRPSLMKNLGEVLRAYRKQHQMSLRELGKETGFSAAYLSDIELGRRMAPKLIRNLITK